MRFPPSRPVLRAIICLLGLLPLFLAPQPLAAPTLEIESLPDGRFRLSWPAAEVGFRLEETGGLEPGTPWTPVAGMPQVGGQRQTLAVAAGPARRFFRLAGNRSLTTAIETSPIQGETGVSVHREAIVRLSGPLAPTVVLDTQSMDATAAGRTVLGRAELSADRLTLTWFPLEPMPPGARVRVVLRGDRLLDSQGVPLDADGDGQPGGTGELHFETLSTAALPGTAVIGTVFASEPGDGGLNRPLAGVTITVSGSEEVLRTTTGDDGTFRLEPAPAGRFFVSVDGRTARESRWPGGAYYPFVGKAWEAVAGRTNNLAGGNGLIFLPLIQNDALQVVSPTETTRVTFTPSVVAAQPELAGVEVRVPPNTLFSESGIRGGRVGIAPVAPDRLPEPLPPGLNLPLVITIQTDGPQNFDQPVPVRFPNLPDPITGVKLPPGAKTVLWSFNHDTGRWEPQGTMTVTADGDYAETDPGVGVRQPGWHGNAPGSPGGGPAPGPPCGSDCDDDDDDDDPDDDDPWKRCKSELTSAATSGADCLVGAIAPTAAPLKNNSPAGCGFGVGYGAVGVARDCGLDPNNCLTTFLNGAAGAGIGCAELAVRSSAEVARQFGIFAKVAGLVHGCVLGFGLNLCTAIDCVQPGSGAACVPDEIEDSLFRFTDDLWNFPGRLLGPTLAGQPAANLPPPIPAQGLIDEARARPGLAQVRLSYAYTRYYETFYGSPVWVGTDRATAELVAPILDAVYIALEPASPAGLVVTPEERASIAALPRPAHVTPADLDALIVRFERIAAGTISAEQLGLVELIGYGIKIAEMTEVFAALGWSHPLNGMHAALAQLTQSWQATCVAPPNAGSGALRGSGGSGGSGAGSGGGGGGATSASLGANGRASSTPRPLQWLLVNLESGFQQRGHTTTGSALPALILAPDTFYGLYFVDEGSGALAVAWFRSAAAGQPTRIPCSLWLEGAAARLLDSDLDGLSDLAEYVIGSNPYSADSDGDGVPDRIELAAGTHPADFDSLPTGPVARAEFRGTAQTIALTDDHHALVGTAEGRLAVLRLDDARPPVLLTQFTAANPVLEVAAQGSLAALALGDAGVQILDLADPAQPRLRHHLILPGVGTVAIHDRWVLVGSANDLLVIDAMAGSIRARLDTLAGSTAVQAIAPAGDWLYIVTNNKLVTLWFENGIPFLVAELAVTGTPAPLERGRKLLVADQRAYVGYFQGYSIFDIANPSRPTLRGQPPSTQAAIHHFAAANPRLLLPVTSFGGIATLAVSLYDVGDPTDVNRFLTSIDTPGEARSLVTHHGLAFVADGSRGVTAINFLNRGPDTLAPTVALAGRWAAPNPVAEPASSQRVPIVADDNTLVRDVTLLLDGRVIARDGGHPFELRFVTPASTPDKTNFLLQAVARDLNGNARTSAPVQVALVADATPPLLESIYPPTGSASPRDFLTAVVVTFGETPATIPPDALRVFGPGPDRVLFTPDDVPLETRELRVEGRSLTWIPTATPAAGTYRAELAAGIADAAGNERPEPLAWNFTLNAARPQLTAVTPNGRLPSFDTLISNVTATLTLPLPASRAPEVDFRLTFAGPDGTWGTADDRTNRLTSVLQLPDLATFELTPESPLGIGTYRLLAQGAPVTSRTVTFSLLDPRAFWRVDTSGRWSDQANWTLPPVAGSQVIVSRPNAEVSVTNTTDTPLLQSVLFDERFVHAAGNFRVRDAAVFNGPVYWGGNESVFVDAVFAAGTFRFRGGLDIASTLISNRRAHVGAATLINEATILWSSGVLESSSADALVVNAPGATFDIGGTARDWEGQGASGRMVNGGLLRKSGTNSVNLSGGAIENPGRIVVEEGTLRIATLSGGGDIQVLAPGILDVYNRFTLPPGGRVRGNGTVLLGFDTSILTSGSPADIRGAWEVTGTTEVRNTGARFLSALDLPTGTLRIGGNATLETPARLGRLEVEIAPTARTGIVNAPLVLGELHLRRGRLAGPGAIAVSERLHLVDGILGSGNDLVLAGRLTGSGGGTARFDDRLLRIAPQTELEAQTTNRIVLLPARFESQCRLLNAGLLRVTSTNVFEIGIGLTNSGHVRLESGTLRIRRGVATGALGMLQGTYLQHPDAILELAGGTLLLDDTQTRPIPGLVRGVGTVTVPTAFGGGDQFVLGDEFRPGNPTGILTLGPGRLGLTANTLTVFDIGASGTAEVRASVRLNGRLRLVFDPGMSVAVGNRWTLFTGARLGTFTDTEVVGLAPNRRVDLLYLPGEVIAEIRAP